ncbi:MAG: hypothetical protein M3211_08275 [Actinomycetota bacterium]|nr:hypothetical protein [Actinomycetota bacterium]
MSTPESMLGLRSVLGGPPATDTTRADHFEYLETGLTPLACGHCGAVVRVRKNSPKHTSIQWTRAAERRCPVLAAHLEQPGTSANALGCERLHDEIAAAARDGRIETGTSEIVDMDGSRDG